MAVTINISNYEEFLLSAMDGELTGEEMAALTAFMDEHPEIRKELELLESTRLQPDEDVKFEAKDMLYRREDVLSADNYERFLLDYVDNELNTSDKAALEILFRQHPHIQKELQLLQASRLTPDLSVTFGDKSSLYRKERTRVRPLWWWSAAAAVVAGLSFWLIPAQRTDEPAQIAVNQGTTTSSPTPAPQATAPAVTAPAATLPAAPDSDVPAIASQSPSSEKAVQAPVSRPSVAPANNNSQSAASAALAGNNVDRTVTRPAAVTNESKQEAPANTIPDNRAIALSKLPQPVSTSGEVVQQLQQKTDQQERILAENAAEMADKSTAMASVTKVNTTSANATSTAAAPANVKGELVVAVTMNGDSKLLNGVANVARFLSRKKK